MENNQNKDGKRNGLITTLLVHVCLLVLCFFLGFTYSVPPRGDVAIGFEALGVPDAGKNKAVSSSENVTKEVQEEKTPLNTQSSSQEDDFVDQTASDVALSKSKSKTKDNSPQTKKVTETTKTVEKQKEVDERLKKMGDLMKGPNNPGGAGDGGKDGSEGSKTGVPGGQGAGGNGSDGMFGISGRKVTKPGDLHHDCGVRGSVKIRIKVDGNGRVVDANMVTGGTSYNECLINKAIRAAKATSYSSNADGPEYVEDVITLSFELN